jgi:hypothetical protein
MDRDMTKAAEAAKGQPPYYDGPSLTKDARQATHRQRLEMSITNAEDRIAKLKEARELLDRYPDLERLLDIMQQSHF